MPNISSFYGIKIFMFWDDNLVHHKPHFHAKYGEYECVLSIPELEILYGKLPKNAMRLVKEWAELYGNELLENWSLMLQNKPLNRIAGLE